MVQDPTAPYVEEVEKPIDYKYYLFLIRKRLYIILTFLIITVTVASIYVSKIPNNYSTYVQLIVERPQRGAVDLQNLTAAEAGGWQDDYYKTQTEIMTSMAVMRLVVEDLNLTSYFGSSDAEGIANRMKGRINVSRLRGSRLFNIKAQAKTAQFAADLANAVARAYIRTNFENRLYYSQEILRWLPDSNSDPNEMITVDSPFGGSKQMTRENLINSLPAIQTDPTLRELREKKSQLESEIDFNLKRYREKHPVMIKQRSNMKFLEETMAAEKKAIIERLKTKAEGRHQLGYARIIEEAPVPGSPQKNDRLSIVLVAVAAQVIICIVIIILLDFFDDTIRSVEDMERKGLILPFLGPISMMKGEGAKANLASFHEKKSDIAESFRYLRVAINFSASPEALRTLLITSCLPHEGKSFVTHNLAISLALDGSKTLLVDGDLRRPVLQRTFKFDNSTGLSSFLTSQLDFEDVVKETFVENLSIVGSGPVSPNPGEILGSHRMKVFIQEAQKHFDRVIIDSPPLTGIGDSFVIGSLIGHVILIVASGKTPAELVKRNQGQLDKAGIKILGTVLNMVDMEKERYGGYYKYYYHTYNRYYNQK